MNFRHLTFAAAAVLALAGCGGRDPVVERTPVPPPEDKPAESQIAYAIEMQSSGDPVLVKEDRKFRTGDIFRFVLHPEFDAYVYLVNRGPRRQSYRVLFPAERMSLHNPIPSGEKLMVPDPDAGWLHMDNQPGDENLILIASTAPLAEFAGMGRRRIATTSSRAWRRSNARDGLPVPGASRTATGSNCSLRAARRIWRSSSVCRCGTSRSAHFSGLSFSTRSRCRSRSWLPSHKTACASP